MIFDGRDWHVTNDVIFSQKDKHTTIIGVISDNARSRTTALIFTPLFGQVSASNLISIKFLWSFLWISFKFFKIWKHLAERFSKKFLKCYRKVQIASLFDERVVTERVVNLLISMLLKKSFLLELDMCHHTSPLFSDDDLCSKFSPTFCKVFQKFLKFSPPPDTRRCNINYHRREMPSHKNEN